MTGGLGLPLNSSQGTVEDARHQEAKQVEGDDLQVS